MILLRVQGFNSLSNQSYNRGAYGSCIYACYCFLKQTENLLLILLTAFHVIFATPIPGGSGAVTVVDSTGKSVQVSQSMVAQAQLGMVQPNSDGTVTIQGSDGQPVKIPQAAIAATPTGGKKNKSVKNHI